MNYGDGMIGRYVAILLTRWRTVLAVATLIVGVVSLLLILLPKEYRSSSALFVSNPGDSVQTFYAGGQYAKERIPSYLALLQSNQFAERVVATLGLDVEPAELIASTTAAQLPGTVTIIVTSSASSPAEAQRINQTTVQEFTAAVAALETVPGVLQPRTQLVVVQPATFEPKPAGLPPMLLLAAAAGFGVALGGLVAVVSALLDKRIREPLDAAAAAEAPLWGVAGPAADPMDPYRQVRSHLTSGHADDPRGTVVLVASAERRVGRTTVALGLSSVLRDAGANVALVECDTRNSVLADRIGSEQTVTVADVVIDKAAPSDVALDEYEGMLVVPAGAVGEHAGRVLDSPRVKLLLDWLRGRYRWIVLDVAAADEYSDALRLAAQADVVLAVASTSSTRFDALTGLARELRSAGTPISGVIVLDATPRKQAKAGDDTVARL